MLSNAIKITIFNRMNLKKAKVNFNISERKVLLWLMDLLAITATTGFLGIWESFTYYQTFNVPVHQWLYLLIIYSFFALVFECYDLRRSSRYELILANVGLAVSWTTLIFLMTPKITPFLPEHRIDVFYFYLIMLSGIFFWRFIYINLFIRPWFSQWVVLVAKQNDLQDLAQALMNSDPYYKIIGFVDLSQKTGDASTIENMTDFRAIPLIPHNALKGFISQHEVKRVVVANHSRQSLSLPLYRCLLDLSKTGLSIRDYNSEYEKLNARVPIQHVKKEFYRFFPYHRANQNKLSLFLQRTVDIIISVLGLVLFMPLFMIIVPILCHNLDKGPIFYVQKRVGRNNKTFNIYKFRTMSMDAEKRGPQFTKKDDIRVLGFCRWIRRMRIDEFPQLFNVIRGDMNLIGPRPERPEFVESLSEKIPFYDVRHVIKPGLTGWAQVNHNYGTSHDDALIKLQYDLYYIKNRSLFLDMSIYIKTLTTILFMRGQ